jgi:hypothetical protein
MNKKQILAELQEQLAVVENKAPVLLLVRLLSLCTMQSQWQVVAHAVFERYGTLSYQTKRTWVVNDFTTELMRDDF